MAIDIPQKINLDVSTQITTEVVYAKQGDYNSRTIECHLKNGRDITYTPPTGTVAELRIKKPNGNAVIKSTTDTTPVVFLSDDVLSFTVIDEMTTHFGDCICEVYLRENGNQVGTGHFTMKISQKAIPDDSIIDASDISAWDSALREASQFNNKIRVSSYTASATTTNIVHNLSYSSTTDDMVIVYKGVLLESGVNYTHNSNGISIDLLDWSISSGDTVYFKVYKNVK